MPQIRKRMAALALVVAASGAPGAAQQHAMPATPPDATGPEAPMSCPMHGHEMQGGMMGAGMPGQSGTAHWDQMHEHLQAMHREMQAMQSQMQSMREEMAKLRQDLKKP